jgi:L-alanine-DL-glutamate epimerase-like enolase superfamily enzyme
LRCHIAFLVFVPLLVGVSALRRELVTDELELVDGRLALPQRPGLGIELNREALERFADAARSVRP